MQINPSIHVVPGLRASNVYLFLNGSHLSLIDCGMPGSEKKIVDYIRSIGKDPEDLEYVLLTHPDIDHVGGVAALKKTYAPKAKVAIGELDTDRLAGRKPPKQAKGAAMKAVMGVMSVFLKFTPVEPEIKLKDQDVIGGLTVVFTPGHTTGSVCFYSKEQETIFVGDTLRSTSGGQVEYTGDAISEDPISLKKSVRDRIAPLDFKVLLPGHGPPVLENASEKVRMLTTETQS